MIKTGQAWAGTFVTLDATGALATPSSGPAGVLYVDGTANAATVTITGSNPYKFAVTLPTLTAGQRVDMYITATIATIGTAGIVASAQADTALVSDVKAETALILADTGTDGVVLNAAGLDADAITEIVTAILTATVESTLDVKEVLRIVLAALAGKVSGGGTSTIKFRDAADALDRITATVDANGNRSAISLNGGDS